MTPDEFKAVLLLYGFKVIAESASWERPKYGRYESRLLNIEVFQEGDLFHVAPTPSNSWGKAFTVKDAHAKLRRMIKRQQDKQRDS